MKNLLILGSFLFSLTASSAEVYKIIVCDNLDDSFPEDTLMINYFEKTATYNDNDVDQRLPCSTLSNGITQCSNGHFTVFVPTTKTDTIVFEGKDFSRKIIFDCNE